MAELSLTAICEWFSPPGQPEPRHYRSTSNEVLAELGSPPNEVREQLLLEAQAAVSEVLSRSESAERRATTIQGSIAIAASLSLAGASLLLDPSKVPDEGWRTGLGVGVALVVVLFAVAAWRAFLVTWPRYLWAAPDPSAIVGQRELDPADIELARVANLLVVVGRNDAIATLQIRLLGQAVRWLVAALLVLAALAIAVAAYANGRKAEAKTTAASIYVLPALSHTWPAQAVPSLQSHGTGP